MLEVIKSSNKFADLVDENQNLEIIAEHFEFLEGPIWSCKEQSLIFNDIPASKTYRWDPSGKKLSVTRENTNKANGNTLDHQHRIVVCEHATSRIARTDINGNHYEVLASHYEGKELNSPNDVVVKSDESIYFTDPKFGRNPSKVGIEREQELSFQGVFMFAPRTQKLTLLMDDFENPNGLCFSKDEKQLYVNDSPRRHIRIFDVIDDGTLENGRLWAETRDEGVGLPDGLKIDSEENVYCCAQGGLHIFNKSGEYIGIVRIPEQAANFTWGDEDLRSIYIAATSSIYKIRTRVPGLKLFDY